MLAKIGTGELLIILLVALIIVGPTKLPKLARSAGKALGTFKAYVRDVSDELEEAIEEAEDLDRDLKETEEYLKTPMPSKRGSEENDTAQASDKTTQASDKTAQA